MQFKVVCSKDIGLLFDIKNNIKKYYTNIDVNLLEDQFLNKWRFPINQKQPMFVVGMDNEEGKKKKVSTNGFLKQVKNQKIDQKESSGFKKSQRVVYILFSCVVEYKFSMNMGKVLHFHNLFIDPIVSQKVLKQFVNKIQKSFHQFNQITINIDEQFIFSQKSGHFPLVKHENYFRKVFQNHKNHPQLLQEINDQLQNQQFYFRFLRPTEDYDRGILELFNDYQNTKKPTKQQFLHHFRQMNESNIEYIHLVGINKKTNRIQAYSSILLYYTIFGKQVLVPTIFIDNKLPNKVLLSQKLLNLTLNQKYKNYYVLSRVMSQNHELFLQLGYFQQKICLFSKRNGNEILKNSKL